MKKVMLILALCAVLWGCGKKEFGKDAQIAAVSVEGLTEEAAEAKLKETYAVLEVILPDGKVERVQLSDIGGALDVDVRRENPVVVRSAKIPEAWVQEICKGTPPQNAKVEMREGKPVIVPEVLGTQMHPAEFRKAFAAYLEHVDGPFDTRKHPELLERPSVTKDDPSLKAEVERLEKTGSISLTLDMTGATETVSPETTSRWMDVEGEKPVASPAKIEPFLETLKEKYDTFGTKRTFHATGKGEITVGNAATDAYGFQLDVQKSAKALAKAINEALAKGKTEVSAKPVWKIPALARTEKGDIGNTYVEIDLSRQHLWYYKEGKLLLETDVVTGKDSTPTPVGVGRVWHKEKNKTLVGEDYRVPVKYWMPFNWKGCGLHDVDYRRAFGGQIYHKNGSHGCVNMPPAMAKKLFELVGYDTPVVVYQ